MLIVNQGCYYLRIGHIPILSITTDNVLTQAASDIVPSLTCTPSNIPPSLQIGDTVKNSVLQIAALLNTNQITTNVISDFEHQQGKAGNTLVAQQPQSNKIKPHLTLYAFQQDIKLLAFSQTNKSPHFIQT